MPGSITLSYGTLFGFLLVLARVSATVTFLPLPGIRQGPEPVRVMFSLALTGALYPAWPVNAVPPGIGSFLVWMASEAAFGVTAGLALSFLLESVAVGCQILGLQGGFSYASTVDPMTSADSSVLLLFAQLLSGMLFFALGLDRAVLRIFAESLAQHPPGHFLVDQNALTAMTQLGAGMLSTGVRLALPVVVLLLLVDIALALLGRIQQQLQLLSLAFPAKMLAALGLLAAVLVVFLPVYRATAEKTFAALGRIL